MLERRGYNETDKKGDKSGTALCQKRHQLAAVPGGESSAYFLMLTWDHLTLTLY